MATIPDAAGLLWTASEVIAHFGDIPIARIRTSPPPGEATEADVIELHDRHGRLFELIDRTLVEKAMGWQESELMVIIAALLRDFVADRRLGKVFGSDGMFRLQPDQIRIPDVSFVSTKRFAGRRVAPSAFWELGCDLAVEVISPSNTRREIERKLGDYFTAGVAAVWLVYPRQREVVVHSSPSQSTTLRGDDTLDGGDVLPGFSVAVGKIFAELDSTGG
ncbi:MAG TPA: Uma2 family endonuclease [Lacipirellulaceae bacterium]|nr:Uma2 family endonuclease [Lacipirellulaceae bacterium]